MFTCFTFHQFNNFVTYRQFLYEIEFNIEFSEKDFGDCLYKFYNLMKLNFTEESGFHIIKDCEYKFPFSQNLLVVLYSI